MPSCTCSAFALPHCDRGLCARPGRWRAASARLVCALVVAATVGLQATAHAALPAHVQSLYDSLELQAPEAVTVAPGGQHVYVASRFELTALARDAGSGALTLIGSWADGAGGVNGLAGSSAVALSPDGQSVYVSADIDDAVAVFSRNGITGALTFVEAQFHSSLDSAAAIAVSPDGDHVYVASGAGGPGSGQSAANAVAVFSRDAGTSALTFVTSYTDGVGGINGLRGAQGIAVSPEGAHVYVAGAGDGAVAVFARDDVTGLLTPVEVVDNSTVGVSGLQGASAITVSADGAHVYVTSGPRTPFWSDDNALVVFERDAGTGALTFVEAHPDGSSGIDGNLHAVSASPDGGHVYVAARRPSVGDPASVGVFERDALTGALTFVETVFDEAGGVFGLGDPGGLALSPDGAHLYVAGTSDEAVAVFERDTLAGSLTFVEAVRGPILGLELPRAVTISPDGAHVYVAASVGTGGGGEFGEIGVFARDPGTGALAFVEVQRDGDQGLTGIGGADAVAVSPDGQHVYVTGDAGDSLAAFDRNGTTGALTFLEAHVDGVAGVGGLSEASGVAPSPDGLHVYASSRATGAIAVFERDGGTGALTFVAVQPPPGDFDRATAMVVAPDGAHVLASYSDPAGLASFARDSGSGLLTLVDVELDLPGRGFEGAWSVVLAPDGRHAYIAGSQDKAVVVVRLEAAGNLTWLQAKTSASADVDDLELPRSLAVAPDGATVLVPTEEPSIGGSGDAFLIFGRNAGTGKLTQRHRFVPGADGVPADALVHPAAAVASPDGRHVYVVSRPRSTFGGSSVPIGRGSITAFVLASPCAAAPVTSGCRSPGRSTLLVQDSPNDDLDTTVFRWLRGEETLPGDLGDPVGGSTDYTLCVYDSGGPGDRLIVDATAPAGAPCPRGPCWELAGDELAFTNSSFKRPDGMLRLRAEAGADDEAKVRARAKGVNLDLRTQPPLVLPVTAQLVNSDGECWSTTFTVDDVRRNLVAPSGSATFSAGQ